VGGGGGGGGGLEARKTNREETRETPYRCNIGSCNRLGYRLIRGGAGVLIKAIATYGSRNVK